MKFPAGNQARRCGAAVWILFLSVFLAIAVQAGPKTPVPHIGYLVLSSLTDTPSPERAAFLQGLREHGYVDGKNIAIDYRSAEGDPEALPFLAEELVELNVKPIVAIGSPVVRAVRQVSTTVPIVMLFAADPVRLGFAHSLARPGTNVTGMTHITTELGPKRLQLLKSALPGITRVALVRDTSNPGTEPEQKAIETAARRMGIHVSIVGLPEVTDDDALRARLVAARPDAIMTMIDPRIASYRQFLPQFALERRIPTMFDWKPFMEAGGLMSYGPDFVDMARRAANFVDKILKGANPAELPIEQPTAIYLTLNLKTARAIGIKFPEDILLRADKVLE
jgi:putative ABC transport system substrate-binding protein